MNRKNKQISLFTLGGDYVGYKYEKFTIDKTVVKEIELHFYPITLRHVILNTHSELFLYIFSFYISSGAGIGK